MTLFGSRGILLALLALSISSVSSSSGDNSIISSLSDLLYDKNERLANHVLLYPTGDCAQSIERYFTETEKPYGYEFRAVSGDAQTAFFGSKKTADEPFASTTTIDDCPAICVEQGVPRHLVAEIMPLRRFQRNSSQQQDDDTNFLFSNWFWSACASVELCGMNYKNRNCPLHLSWLSFEGEWRPTAVIPYGKDNFFCIETFLGHTFRFEDSETEEIVLDYIVPFTSTISVGEAPPYDKTIYFNYTQAVVDTLEQEWARHNKVKRTFSALGFRKGRLPGDVFASMSAFYYNNRNNKVREEWDDISKGVLVNWWERDVTFIQIPLIAFNIWSDRLKGLVETWVNTSKLEATHMYGLRQYEEGSRLLTHVDHEETHAASLIVNIAQGNVEEPWLVEIHDHAGRLHQVEMEPGDIVYYESAKCLHGRNIPLKGKGAYYVNLFTHYRPVGDPLWYEKDISGIQEPLMDVGNRRVKGVPDDETIGKRIVQCDNPSIGPYLSPFLFTARSADDLIQWWRTTGQESTENTNIDDEL